MRPGETSPGRIFMVYKKAEKRAQRGTDIEKAGHKAFGRIKTGMEQNSARAEDPGIFLLPYRRGRRLTAGAGMRNKSSSDICGLFLRLIWKR